MTTPTPDGKITKDYGVKGAAWRCGWHTGTDFRAAIGTIIKAVKPGKVIYAGRGAGWGAAYGIHVIQQIAPDVRFLYAHLSRLDANVLNKKDLIEAETLGLSGATGNTFGPHLHVEARKAPYRYEVDAIDPMQFINDSAPVPVAPAPAPAAPAPAPAQTGEIIHKVTKGQTLGSIAKKYGTTVAALVAKNGIKDPNKIKIGQEIKI